MGIETFNVENKCICSSNLAADQQLDELQEALSQHQPCHHQTSEGTSRGPSSGQQLVVPGPCTDTNLSDKLDLILNPKTIYQTAQQLERLLPLMAKDTNVDAFIATLVKYKHNSHCGNVWPANTVAYRCRTCSNISTMSICADCFRDGDHKGHDYNMFKARTGGTCDCGFKTMKVSGYCKRHSQNFQASLSEFNESNIPPTIVCVPKRAMPRIIHRLVISLRRSHVDLNGEVDIYLDYLINLANSCPLIRSFMIDAMISENAYTSQLHLMLNHQDVDVNRIINEGLKKLVRERKGLRPFSLPKDWPKTGPVSESNDINAFSNNLIQTSMLDELVFWLVIYEFPQKLIYFLLSFVMDDHYKTAFAKSFVRNYPRITMSLATVRPEPRRIQRDSFEQLAQRISHVSIQLFNDSGLMKSLAQEEHIIHLLVYCLRAAIEGVPSDGLPGVLKVNSLCPNYSPPPPRVVCCDSHVICDRRLGSITSDLNGVFSFAELAKAFIRDKSLLNMWVETMCYFQTMNPHKRELTEHTPYENLPQVSSFMIELEYCWGNTCPILEHLRDTSADIGLSKQFLECINENLSRWINQMAMSPNGMLNPYHMSFHIPIHRMLAATLRHMIYRQSLSCEVVYEFLMSNQTRLGQKYPYKTALGKSNNVSIKDFLKMLIMHPLQALTLYQETRSNMWTRNGVMTINQAMNYVRGTHCNLTIDLDKFLLRFAASKLNPNYFIKILMTRFHAWKWLSFKNNDLGSMSCDNIRRLYHFYILPEQITQMVEGMLALLIQLLTLSLHCDITDRDQMKQEIVALISVFDRSHSYLLDMLPLKDVNEYGTSDEILSSILQEVAVYKRAQHGVGGNLQQGYYTLKPEVWEFQYNPMQVLHRFYQRRDYQMSLERFFQSCKISGRLDQKFHQSALWSPLRLPTNPFQIGTFASLDVGHLLDCQNLLGIVYSVLYKTLYVEQLPDTIMAYTIHLLELSMRRWLSLSKTEFRAEEASERSTRMGRPNLTTVSTFTGSFCYTELASFPAETPKVEGDPLYALLSRGSLDSGSRLNAGIFPVVKHALDLAFDTTWFPFKSPIENCAVHIETVHSMPQRQFESAYVKCDVDQNEELQKSRIIKQEPRIENETDQNCNKHTEAATSESARIIVEEDRIEATSASLNSAASELIGHRRTNSADIVSMLVDEDEDDNNEEEDNEDLERDQSYDVEMDLDLEYLVHVVSGSPGEEESLVVEVDPAANQASSLTTRLSSTRQEQQAQRSTQQDRATNTTNSSSVWSTRPSSSANPPATTDTLQTAHDMTRTTNTNTTTPAGPSPRVMSVYVRQPRRRPPASDGQPAPVELVRPRPTPGPGAFWTTTTNTIIRANNQAANEEATGPPTASTGALRALERRRSATETTTPTPRPDGQSTSFNREIFDHIIRGNIRRVPGMRGHYLVGPAVAGADHTYSSDNQATSQTEPTPNAPNNSLSASRSQALSLIPTERNEQSSQVYPENLTTSGPTFILGRDLGPMIEAAPSSQTTIDPNTGGRPSAWSEREIVARFTNFFPIDWRNCLAEMRMHPSSSNSASGSPSEQHEFSLRSPISSRVLRQRQTARIRPGFIGGSNYTTPSLTSTGSNYIIATHNHRQININNPSITTTTTQPTTTQASQTGNITNLLPESGATSAAAAVASSPLSTSSLSSHLSSSSGSSSSTSSVSLASSPSTTSSSSSSSSPPSLLNSYDTRASGAFGGGHSNPQQYRLRPRWRNHRQNAANANQTLSSTADVYIERLIDLPPNVGGAASREPQGLSAADLSRRSGSLANFMAATPTLMLAAGVGSSTSSAGCSRNQRLRNGQHEDQGESVLSLLLRLHSRYSHRVASYTFDPQRASRNCSQDASRLGDGLYFVTMVLDLICVAEPWMARKVERLTALMWPSIMPQAQLEKQQAAPSGATDKETKVTPTQGATNATGNDLKPQPRTPSVMDQAEKRRKAKEYQLKMIAEFATKQKAFIENYQRTEQQAAAAASNPSQLDLLDRPINLSNSSPIIQPQAGETETSRLESDQMAMEVDQETAALTADLLASDNKGDGDDQDDVRMESSTLSGQQSVTGQSSSNQSGQLVTKLKQQQQQQQARVTCYECCICGADEPSDLQNPIGLVVLLQSSSVVGHAHLRPKHQRLLPCEEHDHRRLKEETYAKYLERRIDLLHEHFSESSWLDFINIGAEGGVHVQSCGHYLHIECHRSYIRSLDQEDRPRGRTDTDEFLCPVCRQLANSVLPILPEKQFRPSAYGFGVELAAIGAAASSSKKCKDTSKENSYKLATNESVVASQLAERCRQVAFQLNQLQPPDPKELQSSASFCAHLTKATGPQYRLIRCNASMHSLFLFLASIARTNLEAELIVRQMQGRDLEAPAATRHPGAASVSGLADRPSIDRVGCYQLVFSVLALNAQTLINQPWFDCDRVWTHLCGLSSVSPPADVVDTKTGGTSRKTSAAEGPKAQVRGDQFEFDDDDDDDGDDDDDVDVDEQHSDDELNQQQPHIDSGRRQTATGGGANFRAANDLSRDRQASEATKAKSARIAKLLASSTTTTTEAQKQRNHHQSQDGRLSVDRSSTRQVPLLLGDPIAILIRLLFSLDRSALASNFGCIAQILFNLAAVQSVCLILSHINADPNQQVKLERELEQHRLEQQRSPSHNQQVSIQHEQQHQHQLDNYQRVNKLSELVQLVVLKLGSLLAPKTEQPLMNSLVRSSWDLLQLSTTKPELAANQQQSILLLIDNRAKLACLPFLRATGLLQHHLLGSARFEHTSSPQLAPYPAQLGNSTDPAAVEADFRALVTYLKLNGTPDSQLDHTNPPTETLADLLRWPLDWCQGSRAEEPPVRSISSWANELLAFASNYSIAARTLLVCRALTWNPPSLMQLPKNFDEMFMFYYRKKCTICHQVPKDVAVCLVCGGSICFRVSCCKDRSRSRQVHSQHCGANTAVFLAIHTSSVVVIRGPRACVWGSVYLDAHEEEDNGLQRGRPLYLVQERYNLLQEQWLTHSFDHTCGKRWIYLQDAQ